MVSISNFMKMVTQLPEVIELPHFHLSSFRVQNKIFSTLNEEEKKVMVKLSLSDQSVFTLIDKNVIYPVPGGWGRQGATFIELKNVNKLILKEALELAWRNIAPKKLIDKYFPENE